MICENQDFFYNSHFTHNYNILVKVINITCGTSNKKLFSFKSHKHTFHKVTYICLTMNTFQHIIQDEKLLLCSVGLRIDGV